MRRGRRLLQTVAVTRQAWPAWPELKLKTCRYVLSLSLLIARGVGYSVTCTSTSSLCWICARIGYSNCQLGLLSFSCMCAQLRKAAVKETSDSSSVIQTTYKNVCHLIPWDMYPWESTRCKLAKFRSFALKKGPY